MLIIKNLIDIISYDMFLLNIVRTLYIIKHVFIQKLQIKYFDAYTYII